MSQKSGFYLVIKNVRRAGPMLGAACLTLGIGAVPLALVSWMNRRDRRINAKLGNINAQLEQLYGPLYANRVLEKSYFEACLNSKTYRTHLTTCDCEKCKEKLQEAIDVEGLDDENKQIADFLRGIKEERQKNECQTMRPVAVERIDKVLDEVEDDMNVAVYLNLADVYKNSAMIMDWRQFVVKNLIPLNDKAEGLIESKSHLIRPVQGNDKHYNLTTKSKNEETVKSQYPVEFAMFLQSNAKKRFVAESWKNSSGKLDDESELKVRDYNPGMNGMDIFRRDGKNQMDQDAFLGLLQRDYEALRKEQAELMRKGTAEAEKTEILTTVLGIFGYEL